MLSRLEEENRNRRIYLRYQMEQCRAFGSETGDDANISNEISLQNRSKPFIGIASAEHAIEPDSILLGEPRSGVDTIYRTQFVHPCLLFQIGVVGSAAD